MAGAYLTNLTQGIEKLLNGVLCGSESTLFRRSPRVVTGGVFHPSSSDFHLYLVGHALSEHEPGTFRTDGPDGQSWVLRQPARIQVSYCLLAGQSALNSRIDIWDRLMGYFFDYPHLEPILPDHLHEVPGLVQRLRQEPATLSAKVQPSESQGLSSPSIQVSLKYTALYHSGTVTHRDALVRSRVIDYRNNERRVP